VPATSKLEIERDRVLPDLGESGPALSPDGLPDDIGLYALWPASEQSLAELGLENRPDQTPLIHRPLYVGHDPPGDAPRFTQWISTDRITHSGERVLFFENDVTDGQSGSSLYHNYGEDCYFCTLAIVAGGPCGSSGDNCGSRITKEVFRVISAVKNWNP
jgi:hypothetical protein